MQNRPTLQALICIIALAAAGMAGCTEDPLYPALTVGATVQGLPHLESDLYYELMFSYPSTASKQTGTRLDHGENQYISAGKFTVDSSGALKSLTGTAVSFSLPSGYNPALVIDAVVVIRSSTSPDDTEFRRVMSGPFTGTEHRATAKLLLEDGEAFGEKLLLDSVGRCTLAAPTSSDPADSVSGLWFVTFSPSATHSGAIDTLAGLYLPTQPLNPDNEYWTYQAWLVRNINTATPEYIKLGRFTAPNTNDGNSAGPGAGPMPTRVFRAPGSDFVSPTRRMLNDGTYSVLISLEPDGIELSRPFITLMRLDTIPAGTPAGSTLTLQLSKPSTFTSMEVTFDR